MPNTETPNPTVADLEHLYPPLDADKRAALLLVCRALGLSNAECEVIEAETRQFHYAESCSKDGIKTPSQRRKALAEVQSLAQALSTAIQGLHPFDRTKLWGWMPPEHRTAQGSDYHRVEWIGFELEMLANAAIELRRNRTDETGAKGGRMEKRIHYAEQLDGIIEIVKDKMTIGRGGPFERLCNAVFLAAGVPSNAEGTIRYLMQS